LPLYSTLYLATEKGELAYSDDGGRTWQWRTSYMPSQEVSDIASDTSGNLYFVSLKGEVYKSTD